MRRRGNASLNHFTLSLGSVSHPSKSIRRPFFFFFCGSKRFLKVLYTHEDNGGHAECTTSSKLRCVCVFYYEKKKEENMIGVLAAQTSVSKVGGVLQT